MKAVTPWRDLIGKHFPSINGRTPNDDGWLSVDCPLHNDKKQTAGINLESGRFLCHSTDCQLSYLRELSRPETGAKTLSLAELLHFVHGWSIVDSNTVVESYRVDRLESDFAHNDQTGASESIVHFFTVEVEDFVREAAKRLERSFETIDIAVDYVSGRGLTKDTLVRAGVGFVPGRVDLPDGSTSGVHGCLLFPYWFRSKLVGVRIRQADSRKRMLRNSHYVPYNVNSVFESTSRTIVVGEGETDTLRLSQALTTQGFSNIPVVGTPGIKFDQKWSRYLKRFNRIIAVPQADRPSQKDFVRHLKESFEDRLEIVQIPWDEDALGGKDVCDFLMMRPESEKDLIELLGLTGDDTEDRPYLKTYEYFENRKDRTVDWLIPNVIESGSKVLILGDPKVGKTFIALNLIQSAIQGDPFMGLDTWQPTRSGLRCLLIEEEGSERAIAQRILSIVSPTDKLAVIHGEGVKLDDTISFARLRAETMKFKPDLIVLDPYASLHTQDENTVEGTMKVMNAVTTLYRALPGCTIVILHHRSKLGGGARGSGALWGAVDYQILATRPEGGGKRVVGLSVAGREIDESEPVYFEFDPESKTYTPQKNTAISIVKKSADSTDAFVTDRVLAILNDTPMSTNDIVAKVPGLDYMTVRAVLLDLYAQGQLDRTGSGGRGGFQYSRKDQNT